MDKVTGTTKPVTIARAKAADFDSVMKTRNVRANVRPVALDRMCDFVARYRGPGVPSIRDLYVHHGVDVSTALRAVKGGVMKGLLKKPKEGPRGWTLRLTDEGKARAGRVTQKCAQHRHSMVSSLKD